MVEQYHTLPQKDLLDPFRGFNILWVASLCSRNRKSFDICDLCPSFVTKVKFCDVCAVCEPPGVSECDGNVVSRVTEPHQALSCPGLQGGE